MKKVMKGITRILPAYGVFPLIFSFVFNCLVYSGSRMIAGGWYHHNIETGVDRSLPFVPQFLVIYFGCYLFWAVNYILIARQDRRSVYQFFYRGFYSKMYLPWLFSCIPHNKYTTIDHRRWLMEPGSTLAVFHRCGR